MQPLTPRQRGFTFAMVIIAWLGGHAYHGVWYWGIAQMLFYFIAASLILRWLDNVRRTYKIGADFNNLPVDNF